MINLLFLHAGAELYGADIVMLELIKRLDKRIFNVVVILPGTGPLVAELKQHSTVYIIDYPILRRKYFNPRGVLSYASGFFKKSREIMTIVRKHQISLIHANTSAVWEGAYISRRMGIPLVWEIHEIITHPRFVFKLTSFLIAKYSTHTTTVSNAAREHLLSSGYFKKEIEVIYNGVDTTKFNNTVDYEYLYQELELSKDALIVGMIGRVNSWKGQSDFVNALELVFSKFPQVVGILVGGSFSGEEWRFDELKSKISASRFASRFRLINYRSDTAAILNLIDIFVLPSTHPDPLPTVVLEAMACAKPIIGYRHGGICEMVMEGENGLLVEVSSTIDIADRIATLILDPTRRNDFGKNSLTRLRAYFSIDAYIEKYATLYQRIIANEEKHS